MMLAPISHSAGHIMSIAQTLRGGGVERALLRLASGWTAAGRRVTLVIGKREGPLLQELSPDIDVIELGSDAFARLAVLADLVRDYRPDVLFCPGNHYTSIAAITRLRLGRATPPIVAKISNALYRRDQGLPMAAAYHWWLRRHPGFVDHFVAMSEAMRTETVAAMRVDPRQTSVIANPQPDVAPLAVPQQRGEPLVVGVGRLESQKRWNRLIDAMPRLAEQGARLTILGEGNMRGALEAQISALGLADRVSLPGYVADPAPLIARAAAVALTSDFEGVPGVLLEALAVGTPVVATDASVAMREIVTSPMQGTIVPVGDETALVDALDRWLEPGRPRPRPAPPVGEGSAEQYLALFDRLVAERRLLEMTGVAAT